MAQRDQHTDRETVLLTEAMHEQRQHVQQRQETPRERMARTIIRGNRRRLSALARFFVVVVGGLFVLSLVIPDRDFSETENRSLQTLPAPTLSSVEQGRFQESFQTYIDDQFPFRDLWVDIQVLVSTLMGGIESNDVYLGTDGYLIQDFQEPATETATDAIVEFVRQHPDIPTYALIAPTAVDILSDKLPASAMPDDQAAYLQRVDERLAEGGVNVIDVRQTLLDHKDEGIYYKSDHHWTTYGAYLAYRKACEVMGLDPDIVNFQSAKVADSFDGALKSRSGYFFAPSDTVEVFLPEGDSLNYLVTYVDDQRRVASPYDNAALDRKDKYEVFFGGNHPLIRIETMADNHDVLLVIKDSYANCFIPFLAEQYAKVIVVDPRYYFDDISSLMESEDVTDVLFLYNATTFAEDTSLASMIDSSSTATAEDGAPPEGDAANSEGGSEANPEANSEINSGEGD